MIIARLLTVACLHLVLHVPVSPSGVKGVKIISNLKFISDEILCKNVVPITTGGRVVLGRGLALPEILPKK